MDGQGGDEAQTVRRPLERQRALVAVGGPLAHEHRFLQQLAQDLLHRADLFDGGQTIAAGIPYPRAEPNAVEEQQRDEGHQRQGHQQLDQREAGGAGPSPAEGLRPAGGAGRAAASHGCSAGIGARR
jgi:hypothetical protein